MNSDDTERRLREVQEAAASDEAKLLGFLQKRREQRRKDRKVNEQTIPAKHPELAGWTWVYKYDMFNDLPVWILNDTEALTHYATIFHFGPNTWQWYSPRRGYIRVNSLELAMRENENNYIEKLREDARCRESVKLFFRSIFQWVRNK